MGQVNGPRGNNDGGPVEGTSCNDLHFEVSGVRCFFSFHFCIVPEFLMFAGSVSLFERTAIP
jgi:hypothetical protein